MSQRIPCLFAISITLASTACAQIVIDTFEEGQFNETGLFGGTFTQTGSTTDMAGGKRNVDILAGGLFGTSVASGQFNASFAGIAGDAVALRWGALVPVADRLHLNLSAIPDGGFWVNVAATALNGPAQFSFTVRSGGLRASDSPTIDLATPGNYFFSFSNFTPSGLFGGADFGDVYEVDFSGVMPVGFGTSSITLGSITASPVPEPETYALLSGLGLAGFGLWRRRQQKSVGSSGQ